MTPKRFDALRSVLQPRVPSAARGLVTANRRSCGVRTQNRGADGARGLSPDVAQDAGTSRVIQHVVLWGPVRGLLCHLGRDGWSSNRGGLVWETGGVVWGSSTFRGSRQPVGRSPGGSGPVGHLADQMHFPRPNPASMLVNSAPRAELPPKPLPVGTWSRPLLEVVRGTAGKTVTSAKEEVTEGRGDPPSSCPHAIVVRPALPEGTGRAHGVPARAPPDGPEPRGPPTEGRGRWGTQEPLWAATLSPSSESGLRSPLHSLPGTRMAREFGE